MTNKQPLTWTTKRVKIGDLLEWDINPVQISKRDAAELAKSLDKFDHVLPYVAAAPPNGKHSLPLLDGHQRKMAELQINKISPDTMVDVRIPSRKLTERERKELVVRLRKNTGEFNFDMLANNFDVPDLLDWGFSEKELLGEGLEIGDGGNDAEPQMDRAAELLKVWKVRRGDLFSIGEHRLLCGDSTKREDVERLLTENADLVFADPPYGVKIGDKNKFLNSFQKAGRNLENIAGDLMGKDELFDMLVKSFTLTREFMKDCCAIYVTAPQGGELGMMMMMMMMSGLPVRHVLNWIKNSPTFSMGRLDYEYQHEPILFTWKKNHKHYALGKHTTSTWFIDKPRSSKEHPTMKPVELVENAILNSSQDGDVVYDPFLGSGTTLVACQNLGRRGRGIEISPAYCAVILQRMQDAFEGIKIEKVK